MGALIPAPYRWLAMALLVAAACALAWFKGAAHVHDQWDLENARQTAAVAKRAAARAVATVQVVTRYVDRVQVVRDTTTATLAEVPAHVTPDDDARCTVNRGFVRLHDAAAAGRVPDPTGETDAAPAGIALSAAAHRVAENYGACLQNAEQLIALQDWVRRMAAP